MLFLAFIGGNAGPWRVERCEAVRGAGLASTARVNVVEQAEPFAGTRAPWELRGVTSYERYVGREERTALEAKQQPLGRAGAECAALIPIRKSTLWWELPADERRAILEERSQHIATGLEYLPAISRRLHHGRELGEAFDFLTWFEFAPDDAGAFDELLTRLRATEEWKFVEREVEIRLRRD